MSSEYTNTKFSTIAGVPVHYARSPVANYGTAGKQYNFYCNDKFYDKLENFVMEFSARFGKPEIITSAGAYVAKSGWHGSGMAFDFDAFFWHDRNFITLHEYKSDPKLYMAIEALLRKHFGTVLGWLYNAAHRDHWHVDSGRPVGFNEYSKSNVKFLQAVITHIHEKPCVIDGIWGVNTAKLATELLEKYNLRSKGISPEVNLKGTWSKFLDAVIVDSMENPDNHDTDTPEMNPLELLHNVYATIDEELGSTSLKKPIESALNSFSNHEQVQKFLKDFR
jgi:hypothetical protein